MAAKSKSQTRPSSSMPDFRKKFAAAKYIVVLTGAGVSAESGVPTFRGAGGFWRTWQAQQLATPEAFESNPSLVWEFYHYRREVMASKEPNKAHIAIAECEQRLKSQGRKVVVITQNIDELHKRAGSKNIYELHGSLFKTRCTKCRVVKENRDSPICEALAGKGAPDPDAQDARIPVDKLPRCKENNCGGLLRPHVVWFGESLDPNVLSGAEEELEKCDLCLVVGTSSVVYPAAMFAPMVASRGVPVAEFVYPAAMFAPMVASRGVPVAEFVYLAAMFAPMVASRGVPVAEFVYPAAMFAPMVASRGVPVAEFNMEETDKTSSFGFHFQGPAGTHVPVALAKHESEP